jgi:hypothetical protein
MGLWYRIDPVTIIEPSLVVASLRLSRTATCATQAQVTLTASGGTVPYSYSNGTGAYVPFTGSSTIITVNQELTITL